jgi:hypothetical protein
MVMDVSPVEERLQLFLSALSVRDLVFAACGPEGAP